MSTKFTPIENYKIHLAINNIVEDMYRHVEEGGKCEICNKDLVFGDPQYTKNFFCSAECDLEADKQWDNHND